MRIGQELLLGGEDATESLTKRGGGFFPFGFELLVGLINRFDEASPFLRDFFEGDQAARKAVAFAVENESFSDRDTGGNRDALQFQHALVNSGPEWNEQRFGVVRCDWTLLGVKC